jgi:hypothetical protein
MRSATEGRYHYHTSFGFSETLSLKRNNAMINDKDKNAGGDE